MADIVFSTSTAYSGPPSSSDGSPSGFASGTMSNIYISAAPQGDSPRLAGHKRKGAEDTQDQRHENGDCISPPHKRTRYELATVQQCQADIAWRTHMLSTSDSTAPGWPFGASNVQRATTMKSLTERATRSLATYDGIVARLQWVLSDVQKFPGITVRSSALPLCDTPDRDDGEPGHEEGSIVDSTTHNEDAVQEQEEPVAHNNEQADVSGYAPLLSRLRPRMPTEPSLWTEMCKRRIDRVIDTFGQPTICAAVRHDAQAYFGVDALEPCGHAKEVAHYAGWFDIESEDEA